MKTDCCSSAKMTCKITPDGQPELKTNTRGSTKKKFINILTHMTYDHLRTKVCIPNERQKKKIISQHQRDIQATITTNTVFFTTINRTMALCSYNGIPTKPAPADPNILFQSGQQFLWRNNTKEGKKGDVVAFSNESF